MKLAAFIGNSGWNAGSKQAKLMEIITPGAFAHYFEELAAILGAGRPPDQEKLADLHRKYAKPQHGMGSFPQGQVQPQTGRRLAEGRIPIGVY